MLAILASVAGYVFGIPTIRRARADALYGYPPASPRNRRYVAAYVRAYRRKVERVYAR